MISNKKDKRKSTSTVTEDNIPLRRKAKNLPDYSDIDDLPTQALPDLSELAIESDSDELDSSEQDNKNLLKPKKEKLMKNHYTGFRRIIALAVIVIIAILGIIIYANKDNINPENLVNWVDNTIAGNEKGTGYPVNISGTSVQTGNFTLIDDAPAVLSDTSFSIYNKTGNMSSNRQHSYNSPILKTSKNYSLIYDLGGTGFNIQNKAHIITDKTLENKIITAAISDKGTYAIVTSSTGYFSETTIYDKADTELFRWNSSQYSIIGVDINSAANSAAMLGITSDNGEIKSAVYIFKFNSEEPLVFEYSDSMMLDIKYLKNDNIVVVGQDFTTIINTKTNEQTKYTYPKNSLLSYSIDPTSGISLANLSYSNSNLTTLINIDSAGKQLYSLTIADTAIDVAINNKKTAVLTKNKLYYFSADGILQSDFTTTYDIHAIALTNSTAYLLGSNSIHLVQFHTTNYNNSTNSEITYNN